MYGRNIYNPTSLLNNFVQSSAADCACLAFSELVKKFHDKQINVVAFIHDSIIIDCHPNYFDFVSTIDHISEDTLDIVLPVRVSEIK